MNKKHVYIALAVVIVFGAGAYLVGSTSALFTSTAVIPNNSVTAADSW